MIDCILLFHFLSCIAAIARSNTMRSIVTAVPLTSVSSFRRRPESSGFSRLLDPGLRRDDGKRPEIFMSPGRMLAVFPLFQQLCQNKRQVNGTAVIHSIYLVKRSHHLFYVFQCCWAAIFTFWHYAPSLSLNINPSGYWPLHTFYSDISLWGNKWCYL